MPKRTCYCPPWWLRDTLHIPWRWLPLAFLRWQHRMGGMNCAKRAQAVHDGYIDYRDRYLFHDRLMFAAWSTGERNTKMLWELRSEIAALRHERSAS